MDHTKALGGVSGPEECGKVISADAHEAYQKKLQHDMREAVLGTDKQVDERVKRKAEIVQLLKYAIDDFERLSRANVIMHAQLQIVENMCQLANPGRSYGGIMAGAQAANYPSGATGNLQALIRILEE